MMEYRSVGNRCAVLLDSFQLPISRKEALAILVNKGFAVMAVDIVGFARQCVGHSEYRRGARLSEAPRIVDCSSFVKWLYAQRGIWLPRRSIQQRGLGEAINFGEIDSGDLVFVSGWIDYYIDNPAEGVGHVGVATGDGTVIHASNPLEKVTETPLQRFVGRTRFRGARRYVPRDHEVLTLEIPPHREVETAEDIKWVILQSLPKRVKP